MKIRHLVNTGKTNPKRTQSKPIKAKTNPIKANKMPKQTQYKPKQSQLKPISKAKNAAKSLTKSMELAGND